MDSQAKVGQAEGLLQKIHKLKDLVLNRGELIRKLEELKPHNLWEKMRNPSQNEIMRSEQDLDRLQTRIDGLKKEISEEYPGKNTVKAESQMNEQIQISGLRGAHKAIEQEFRGWIRNECNSSRSSNACVTKREHSGRVLGRISFKKVLFRSRWPKRLSRTGHDKKHT